MCGVLMYGQKVAGISFIVK